MPEIVARGAEAVLYIDEHGNLVKERIRKGYRIAEIDDALRTRRTRSEANLIRKARSAGVSTPKINSEDRFKISMEFIQGKKVRDMLDTKTYKDLCKKIGKSAGILHSFDIIHGDLTTSNMIVKNKDIYVIDFGLGFVSKRAEDKATDLYLLHEALESTHFDIMKNAWKIILKAYAENYGESKDVINALKKIEMRRRYTKKE